MLFVVIIQGGNSHPDYYKWKKNVQDLNGKSPDYAGINNLAIISTHHDLVTLKSLVTDGMKNSQKVTITEITDDALAGEHGIYIDLIKTTLFLIMTIQPSLVINVQNPRISVILGLDPRNQNDCNKGLKLLGFSKALDPRVKPEDDEYGISP